MIGMSWFKIHRQIFENGTWRNPLEFRLFIWLIGNAVYDSKSLIYGDVKITRGQYLRSFRKLQDDLTYIDNNQVIKPALGTIHRAVEKLVRREMILTLETELGTLFTIINYEKYQGNSKHLGESETELGTELGTSAEHPLNNTKKDKKDKNIYICSDIENMFNEFWSIYPKKVSKKKTLVSFKKIKDLNKGKFEIILKALKEQKESSQWQNNNGQYIPHPTSWLNQERWEDETPRNSISPINKNQQTLIPEYLR